jgi:hypothetical protein
MLKRAFNGTCTSTRRTSHGNDGMFLGHGVNPKKLLNKIDTQVLSSKPGDRPKIIIFFEPLFSQFSQNPGQTHLIFER